MSETSQRSTWHPSSHETKVEKFYEVGVEHYGEYHQGYLNFGLWEEGMHTYLEAAENLVRRMGTLLGLTAESHLLDVACGMGTQDVLLYQTFGCTIDTVDVTWKHVEHAKARVERAGLSSHISVHHGTATALPFSAGTFSHVLCIEGAEHVNTREKFLYEAARVLQPGGVIALADYVLTREPRTRIERLIVEAARRLWRVPKANYETSDSYQRTMERAGFRDVTIKAVGAQTIPGYYAEATTPTNLTEQRKIRGFWSANLARLVDYSVYNAYAKGLIEYVLVKGTV